MARLDLQIEVLRAAPPSTTPPQVQPDPSLGDDAPRSALGRLGGAAPGQEDARRSRRASSSRLRTGRARGSRGVVRARTRGCRRVPGDDRRDPRGPLRRASRRRRRSHRALEALDVLGQMGERGSLAERPVASINKQDARRRPATRSCWCGCTSPRRRTTISAASAAKASKRRVVFTTDAEDDLVLHWGVARDERVALLPKETVWPADTEKVSEISVETPFIVDARCLPAAEAAAAGGTVAEEEEECHPLQVLTLELPGEGAEELTGVQFVLRNAEGTVWYKDETNGNSNFRANYVAPARTPPTNCSTPSSAPKPEEAGGRSCIGSISRRLYWSRSARPRRRSRLRRRRRRRRRFTSGCGTPRSASSPGSATTTSSLASSPRRSPSSRASSPSCTARALTSATSRD